MKRCLVVLALLCFAAISYSQTCSGPLSVTIVGSSSANPLDADGESTDSACNESTGGLTGSVTLEISGGSEPYSYEWTQDGSDMGLPTTTDGLSQLGAGTYAVTITDVEGCYAELSFVVAEPDPIDVPGTPSNPTCEAANGAPTGSITVTPTGGTGVFDFAWTGPNGYTSSTTDAASDLIQDLAGGEYTVVVTDENGCTNSNSFTLDEPEAIAVQETLTDLDCDPSNGLPSGQISVTASGGTSPYDFAWTGPNGFTSSTDNAASDQISDLAAGDYTVVVTDANNCTTEATYTLSDPEPITVLAVTQDLSCHSLSGQPDGLITVTPSGGTAPYNFNWSTGTQEGPGASSTIDDLVAGTYQITVVDAKGCTYEATWNLTQPDPVSATYTFENPTCNNASGAPTGSITMQSTIGGTGAGTYDYEWATGETTADLSNLGAGTYTVTITDDNECTYTESFTLAEPDAVTCSVDPDVDGNCGTNISCNAGTADVTVTAGGGTGTYTYSVDGTNFQASNVFNLGAGTHTITTQDSEGCESTCEVTLTEPEALTGFTCVENDECQVGEGEIKVEAFGGCAPYTVTWSAAGAGTLSSASETINSDGGEAIFTGALGGETYTFTIIDANGCQIGG